MEQLKSPMGVLIVDKEKGMTSHDVVARVRRLFGTMQVGHTGTLDPDATGVLPVLIGRAVKASEYLLSDNKSYEALLRLGVVTDTEDMTGKVLSVCRDLPDKETVQAVCARFKGRIAQIPPMYSALKRGGKKLVDLARAGIEVERDPRPVSIYTLDVDPVDPEEGLYRLKVDCSGGTYIRTLCADVGRALGCGGAMEALRRTASGPFRIEDARALAQIEALDEEERAGLLRPLETLFADLPALMLPPFYRRLSSSGCPVYLEKLGVRFDEGTLLRLYDQNVFYALGKVGIFPEGPAVKAVKQFYLFDRDHTKC